MSEAARAIVNGETLLLDQAGAVYWPAEQTLVLADLHFEKGSSFARRGMMLPPYDTKETLARIAELFARHRPARVISLGDSFHDGDGPSRLDPKSREQLDSLIRACEWIWIEGNHDAASAATLGGRVYSEVAIGNLLFRHEPLGGMQMGEIAGHLHPCTSITRRGRSLRRRCFLTDGVRLVMPSFGAYTGGLDMRDAAFVPLFANTFMAYALGSTRVYAVAARGDAQSLRRKITEDSQPRTIAIVTADNP
ncbi:MAG TPA: ligase-associated DNA damage response endonuclease PdeM [Rhizomicrobium sp.]|nr:ligase-associated DNA damage response endonuclease PdeM [Rhizomicrobium sp.]